MNPSENATIASILCRSWMSQRWCSNPHNCQQQPQRLIIIDIIKIIFYY